MSSPLQERFSDLLQRHVCKLAIRGTRATGLCPFHNDRHPSFSADLEQGVFYCFGCAVGGGVRKFAELAGEPWASTKSESRAARACCARFQAERHAQAILRQRQEKQDKTLCAAHRAAHAEVVAAADLLALFHRRPDLAEEFSDLVARTEREYGDAIFRREIMQARLDGVVE